MKTKNNRKPASTSPARLQNVHPGRMIDKLVIKGRDLTQTQLAEATGLPVSRINDLIKGRRGITIDSAIRLARALGTSPDLWLGLQRDYDMEEAMLAKRAEYESIKALPVPKAA